MPAARVVVVLFMVLAMLCWGVLGIGTSLWAFDFLLEKSSGTLLHVFVWLSSLLGFLIACYCSLVNTRPLNLAIAAFALIATSLGLFTYRSLPYTSPWEALTFFVMFQLGMPLIVAGGYAFLRLTRHHGTQPPSTIPAEHPHYTLGKFLMILAVLLWSLTLIVRLNEASNALLGLLTLADRFSFAALGSTLLAVGFTIVSGAWNTRRNNLILAALALTTCAFDFVRLRVLIAKASRAEWSLALFSCLAVLLIVLGLTLLRRHRLPVDDTTRTHGTSTV